MFKELSYCRANSVSLNLLGYCYVINSYTVCLILWKIWIRLIPPERASKTIPMPTAIAWNDSPVPTMIIPNIPAMAGDFVLNHNPNTTGAQMNNNPKPGAMVSKGAMIAENGEVIRLL